MKLSVQVAAGASRWTGVVLLACSALGVAAKAGERPHAGRHAADFCVRTSADAPPGCGRAQVDLRGDGSVRVRLDDIVYQLQLHGRQVDVLLTHGAVQIDQFTAPYEWVGSELRFTDEDRGSRYEIRFHDRDTARR